MSKINHEKLNNPKKVFISRIIVKHLHMEMKDFKQCLKKGDCYEESIYRWLAKLYSQKKTVEYSVQVIYRARSLYMYQKFKKERCTGLA